MLLMMNWDSTVWIADGNCGFVKRLKRQKSNAQNLSRINQRKDHNISKITDNL